MFPAPLPRPVLVARHHRLHDRGVVFPEQDQLRRDLDQRQDGSAHMVPDPLCCHDQRVARHPKDWPRLPAARRSSTPPFPAAPVPNVADPPLQPPAHPVLRRSGESTLQLFTRAGQPQNYDLRLAVCWCCWPRMGQASRCCCWAVLSFGLGLGNVTSLPPLVVQQDFAPADIACATALVTACYAFASAAFGLLRDLGTTAVASLGSGPPLLFVVAALVQVTVAGTAGDWSGLSISPGNNMVRVFERLCSHTRLTRVGLMPATTMPPRCGGSGCRVAVWLRITRL